MTAYQDNCATIARNASVYISRASYAPERAVRMAAEDLIDEAKRAHKRLGIYASEMTTEELETIAFLGTVAEDVIDGSIERPSTGNVKGYVLSLIIEKD